MKPVILFDLDGTLLDTAPVILETYRRLFMKYRNEEEFDEQKQLSVLGPPLRKMFAIFFPEQDVEELVKEYQAINLPLHHDYVKLIPNADVMLHALKDKGYKMGIVSTKATDSVIYGLDVFGLTECFDIILGNDRIERQKPDPQGILKAIEILGGTAERCIYIGDTVTDVEAGRNAGVYTVGFVYDPRREEAIRNSDAHEVISDLYEMIRIAEEM
ncbi:MAG: HAD family hydrolase [Erysipelotrichaceae bacterium]|mgnify:FL=1|nr:HAD family hydrolase [Erysipelotrichaceae bacterium]